MTVEFYSLVFPNVGEMYTHTPEPFGRVMGPHVFS
jgi:hypothetical protein